MEAWTVTSPSGFSIGKNTVYPGETVTCTWNPSTGDFDSYCLEAFEQGDFIITSEKQSFTVSKAATSYAVTIPENATVGNHIQFVIQAQKGAEGASKPVGVYPEIVSNSPETLPAPGFITVSDAIHGSEVTIRWGAVSIAAPYSGGYTVQRSVNGGPFGEETEDGMNNTFHTNKTELTQTVGEDWNTVQYRVRAWGYNADGSAFLDSDWTASEVKTVQTDTPSTPVTGGRLEQFQNSDGTNIYPKTVVEGVIRQRDGRSLEQVLADVVPTSRKVNGQALSSDITLITCGTADLTAGSSPLAAGTLYGVYEV